MGQGKAPRRSIRQRVFEPINIYTNGFQHFITIVKMENTGFVAISR